MNKSVLVIDTPRSCGECPFMTDIRGTKACQYMGGVVDGERRISQSNYLSKCHPECPLVEIPQMDGLMAAATVPDCMNPVAYARGWNDLRNKLEK